MREAKAKWIRALRDLTGVESDTIRFNEEVWRWEFVLRGADNVPRSQFYGEFKLPVDPTTGMHPFKELDDDGMRVVLKNLAETFVGNPFDGDGTTQKEVWKRYQQNKTNARKKYREAGEAFADMAAERGHRLRGAGFSGSGGSVASRARADKPLIEIPVVLGGSK